METTVDIILPISGMQVTLSKRLTYGESIAIDKILFQNVKATSKGDQTFSAESTFAWKRQKILTLVKKMFIGGNDLPINNETIDNLDSEDGKFLEDKIEEILAESKKSR